MASPSSRAGAPYSTNRRGQVYLGRYQTTGLRQNESYTSVGGRYQRLPRLHQAISHLYRDASDFQLGAAILQDDRPIAY